MNYKRIFNLIGYTLLAAAGMLTMWFLIAASFILFG
jgi:hypothetical protein